MENVNVEKLTAIKYARKSSEPDDRQVLSLPSQVKELADLAGRTPMKVVETYQEAKSAKKPNNRPMFSKMLERIENGEANCIVVWHPDRLSRNPVDASAIVYLIDTGKLVKVITPQQTFSNTPMDKFMLQFLMITAKLENDNKGENVKRGMKSKLEGGGYPFVARQGYLNTPDRAKGEKTVVKDPERFPMVRKMWDLLLTGQYNVPQILDIVNNKWDYKTPKHRKMGGKSISRSALYDLFRNPFYYGWFEVNGQLYHGNHEPMITKKEYDKAQAILRRFDAPRPKTLEHRYTGLIHCGICGCAITATHKEKFYPKTKNTAIYDYYHCSKRRQGITCNQEPNTQKYLEDQIIEILTGIEIEDDFREWAIKYLREKCEYENKEALKYLKTKQTNYKEVEERLGKLLNMRMNEELTADEYKIEKEKALFERETAKGSIEKLEREKDAFIKDAEDLFDFAERARYKFTYEPDTHARAVLAELGKNFILKDGILSGDLKKGLTEIRKCKNTPKDKIPALEPADLVGVSSETARLATANPIWLLRLDSNQEP